ncbi:hypothetical protein ACFSSB_00415 [Lacinutrix gracilariae]|uniref:Uncharacterized protein n=1 Tax=Lacinutrix gracilariae TaxID=1747198 RepID=A0ABW5JX81_9FLAO
MKKVIFLFAFCIALSTYAQQGINYKAIIKDDLGNVIANQSVTVQFTILEGATNVYQETHAPTTDANGVIIVNIGEGTTTDVFTAIAWGTDEHWLNVQIDSGAGLVDLGTTQFMAVPYALSSRDNPWLKNEEGIHVINNDVGIGVANPEAQLDVRGGDWNLDAGNPGDLRIGNATSNFRIGVATGGGGAGITRMYSQDALLIGTNDRPSLTIAQNENVGIGTTTPNTKLQISGGSDASNSNGSGYMVLGNEPGLNLVFDNNEIIARNNTDSSALYIQQTGGSTNFGGDVSVSGVATTPSMDIANIESASSKVLVTKEYTEAKYSKRTKEIVIPSMAFQPSGNYHPVPRPLAGGPDLPATDRYHIIHNGLLFTLHDDAMYMAPLTLPVGSTVNQISAFLYDNEFTNLQFSLTATRLTTNIYVPIFTLTTDNSNSNQELTHSTPLTILSDYMYFFTITTAEAADWGEQGIKGIKVIYTE